MHSSGRERERETEREREREREREKGGGERGAGKTRNDDLLLVIIWRVVINSVQFGRLI